jgi:nucleotide-binding universal stress UspA family protein
MQTVAPPGATPAGPPRAGQRVLVVYETGRAGTAALDLARGLADREHASVTVVCVAPQVPCPRCGGSALDYNSMLREEVAKDLEQAREHIREIAGHTDFELLIEGQDPPLHDWCAAAGFDMILLPARRRPLRAAKHPEAARIRRCTAADVRVVNGRPG